MSQSPDQTTGSDTSPDRGGSETAPGRPLTDGGPGEAATEEGSPEAAADEDAQDQGGRTVVVPTEVYKRVTVFSTLFAVVSVVGGFIVLDSATDRARAPLDQVDPLLALVGLGLIVLGAVTYAFSTRFQAEGMGNAKDDTDEPSDNG